MGRGGIGGRLRRVGWAARAVVRCPGCGLRPQDKGHIVVDDKDPAPELPGVCPACGRDVKIRIRVVYEAEGGGDAA